MELQRKDYCELFWALRLAVTQTEKQSLVILELQSLTLKVINECVLLKLIKAIQQHRSKLSDIQREGRNTQRTACWENLFFFLSSRRDPSLMFAFKRFVMYMLENSIGGFQGCSSKNTMHLTEPVYIHWREQRSAVSQSEASCLHVIKIHIQPQFQSSWDAVKNVNKNKWFAKSFQPMFNWIHNKDKFSNVCIGMFTNMIHHLSFSLNKHLETEDTSCWSR